MKENVANHFSFITINKYTKNAPFNEVEVHESRLIQLHKYLQYSITFQTTTAIKIAINDEHARKTHFLKLKVKKKNKNQKFESVKNWAIDYQE